MLPDADDAGLGKSFMTQSQDTTSKTAAPAAKGHRHGAATALLEAAIEPVCADMGYEALLVEWSGSGQRRVLRVFLDSPKGVTIADCTRMGRLIGNSLDAAEAAVEAGEGSPALAALLAPGYTLEVSSPGVDRPLAKKRHFAAQVGGRVKLKTWESPAAADADERSFNGRLVAVHDDDAAPEDQRRGTVVVHDPERDRTIPIPLPLIRRANLVWEG